MKGLTFLFFLVACGLLSLLARWAPWEPLIIGA
jgi:hypothetical protein